MKVQNSTGYDRTKGSKRVQGIITPKAPQNRLKRRGVFSPRAPYRLSPFDMLLGTIALNAFKAGKAPLKAPVKIAAPVSEKKGIFKKFLRRGVR